MGDYTAMMVNRQALGNHMPIPLNHGETILGKMRTEFEEVEDMILPYYTIEGRRILTAESIGILAYGKSIQIETANYLFDDLEGNGYILAECKAVTPAGDSAIGAHVEKQGMHAFASAFSKVQRNAMAQLIPQSEIKAALGYDVNGFEPHRLVNHYNAAFAAKKSLDKRKKVSHKGFWDFVKVESMGKISNCCLLYTSPSPRD